MFGCSRSKYLVSSSTSCICGLETIATRSATPCGPEPPPPPAPASEQPDSTSESIPRTHAAPDLQPDRLNFAAPPRAHPPPVERGLATPVCGGQHKPWSVRPREHRDEVVLLDGVGNRAVRAPLALRSADRPRQTGKSLMGRLERLIERRDVDGAPLEFGPRLGAERLLRVRERVAD